KRRKVNKSNHGSKEANEDIMKVSSTKEESKLISYANSFYVCLVALQMGKMMPMNEIDDVQQRLAVEQILLFQQFQAQNMATPRQGAQSMSVIPNLLPLMHLQSNFPQRSSAHPQIDQGNGNVNLNDAIDNNSIHLQNVALTTSSALEELLLI
ncbi:hypothetical protein RFI_01113, partial [Reticulomyxa filosa]